MLPYQAARPSRDFAESVGVNVHMGYGDTPYGDVDGVLGHLHALGVRHVRDGVATWQNAPQVPALLRLGASGVRLTAIGGDPQGRYGTGTVEQQAAMLLGTLGGMLEAVEGPNEYDATGGPGWLASLRDYMTRLAALVGDRALLIAPSFATGGGPAAYGIDPHTACANLHPYPGSNPPERNIDSEVTRARLMAAGPIYCTETGYRLVGPQAVPEVARAAYTPRLVAEWFRAGAVRTFLYQLLDDHEGLGLVAADGTRTPAFAAVAALLAATRDDPGATPDSLPLAVIGPARYVLLGRTDGTFRLLLWRTGPWDGPTAPVTVRTPAGEQTVDVGPQVTVLTLPDRVPVFTDADRADLLGRVTKAQSVGATILSNMTQAKRLVDRL